MKHSLQLTLLEYLLWSIRTVARLKYSITGLIYSISSNTNASYLFIQCFLMIQTEHSDSAMFTTENPLATPLNYPHPVATPTTLTFLISPLACPLLKHISLNRSLVASFCCSTETYKTQISNASIIYWSILIVAKGMYECRIACVGCNNTQTNSVI